MLLLRWHNVVQTKRTNWTSFTLKEIVLFMALLAWGTTLVIFKSLQESSVGRSDYWRHMSHQHKGRFSLISSKNKAQLLWLNIRVNFVYMVAMNKRCAAQLHWWTKCLHPLNKALVTWKSRKTLRARNLNTSISRFYLVFAKSSWIIKLAREMRAAGSKCKNYCQFELQTKKFNLCNRNRNL